MKILSNGMPSTLKSYKILTEMFFGVDSPQAEFINKKISESTVNGEDEEVIVDESQMLYLLGSMIPKSE